MMPLKVMSYTSPSADLGGGQGGHAPQDAKSCPLPCLAYAVHYTLQLQRMQLASVNPLSRHK